MNLSINRALSLLALSAWMVGCASNTAPVAGTETSSADREIASNEKLRKCADRIRKAGCYLSNNDYDRIGDNVRECKHFESSTGKSEYEVMLLKESGRVVVVKTDGADVYKPNCPAIKYTIDRDSEGRGRAEKTGIQEVKIIKNRVWMYSADGQVYFMNADEAVYELLNSKKKSYSSVTDIKGLDGGTAIQLIFENGQTFDIDSDKLQDKIREKEVRKIWFVRHDTNRSLYRDE